jgi:ABC-type Zn uptake system ZnuABC Zn-binding protein ZnuA
VNKIVHWKLVFIEKCLGIVFTIAVVFSMSTTAHASIVVTVHPIKILLTDFGVPADRISTLVPPGIDLHSFEMVPSQIKLLNDASIILSSSGVELNLSLLKNSSWAKKITSIGDPVSMSEHGWLNPELVLKAIPLFVLTINESTQSKITQEQVDVFTARFLKVFSEHVTPQCAYISDHSMLSSFARYISCKEVSTLRPNNSTAEFTPRSLQMIKKYKKDFPHLIFIGSTSSPRSMYNTLRESFDMPTREVDESAQKENSFIDYYRSILSVFLNMDGH